MDELRSMSGSKRLTPNDCEDQSIQTSTLTEDESHDGSDTTSGYDSETESGNDDGAIPSGTEPWGVGSLVLAPNGNLLISPDATWYRPVQSRSGTPGADAFDAATSWPEVPVSSHLPHESPHLPMRLSAEDHARLVDCAFTGQLSLGMNAWRSRFLDAMNAYCSRHGDPLNLRVENDVQTALCAWFSPALHLVIIFNGLRSCPDEKLVRRYLGQGEDYRDRGMVFLEAARSHATGEAARPQLSTITAHLLICSGYVGMSHE